VGRKMAVRAIAGLGPSAHARDQSERTGRFAFSSGSFSRLSGRRRCWFSENLYLLGSSSWCRSADTLSLLKIVETSRTPQFRRAVPIPSGGMVTILFSLVSLLSFRFRSRASLELELVALRHQVIVLRRQRPHRLRLLPPIGSCGSGFTECGRRSSKHRYSSNRRLWSSGVAKAFGFTGDGDHAVPGGPRRVTKYGT
jgi:hypothetical protein